MKDQNLTIPMAIIIAGVLVAGAVFFSNRTIVPDGGTDVAQEDDGTSTDLVAPVTENDHIRGDINAPVKIVEYSDFECPFCKRFHGTMNQIMDEYEESGQVAWVFRQFPLEQLHPVKAARESVASECIAELGGNSAFWQFADRFFELTPSNNRTDIDTVLPQIAREIGLDEQAFNECLNSDRYNNHIQADIKNAVETGGGGTPWSIVIGPDGATYPLSGSLPFNAVKQLIELALQNQ